MRGYPVGMKEFLLLIKRFPAEACGGNHEPAFCNYDIDAFPVPVDDAIKRKLIVVVPCPHDHSVRHSTITPLGLIALTILNIDEVNIQSMTQG